MTNRATIPTTVIAIMMCPKFGLGAMDVRAGRGRHPSYESWPVNEQWNYERGRAWATVAPASVALKQAGKVTTEAIRWYRAGQYIL
jgi:hypothetical protein